MKKKLFHSKVRLGGHHIVVADTFEVRHHYLGGDCLTMSGFAPRPEGTVVVVLERAHELYDVVFSKRNGWLCLVDGKVVFADDYNFSGDVVVPF
jgi:hypothetical protein